MRRFQIESQRMPILVSSMNGIYEASETTYFEALHSSAALENLHISLYLDDESDKGRAKGGDVDVRNDLARFKSASATRNALRDHAVKPYLPEYSFSR